MKRILHMTTAHAVALLSIITATTGPLHAAEFTLDQIVAAARENNPDLKALRAERGSLEARRVKAGLSANPVLDLEAATGALTGSPDESRISIGLSREFNTGGKKQKRMAVADAGLALFLARVKEQERLTLLEVKLGVHDLQLAQGRVELARRSMELNERLLQVARERFAAGDVAELEVNLAKVEATRSAEDLLGAEGDLALSRLEVARLTGVLPGEKITVADDGGMAEAPRPLEELKGLARSHRPDLEVARLESAQGEAELQLARAGQLPDLTAGIGVSRESSLTSVAGLEEKETEYLLGVKLSIPIPLFDRNQAEVQEAQSRVGSARGREALARQQVEIEVERAFALLDAAQRSLNSYDRQILPQLGDNVKIVQEAYRLGEMGISSVIEEQKKLHEATEGRLRALQRRNAAKARLEAAVGLEFDEMHGGRQ